MSMALEIILSRILSRALCFTKSLTISLKEKRDSSTRWASSSWIREIFLLIKSSRIILMLFFQGHLKSFSVSFRSRNFQGREAPSHRYDHERQRISAPDNPVHFHKKAYLSK